jgi:flagellar biosynthesis/type III secretory pathway protein FliH
MWADFGGIDADQVQRLGNSFFRLVVGEIYAVAQQKSYNGDQDKALTNLQGFAVGYQKGLVQSANALYQELLSDGFTLGEAFGYTIGYSDGFRDGYSQGYAAGWQAGYNSGFNSGQSNWLNGLGNIMNGLGSILSNPAELTSIIGDVNTAGGAIATLV